MNKKTLLGIYAGIEEIADVGITFYDNTTGNYMLPEEEEQACRRAQKIVKAISDEPEPEPPKEPINWLKFQEAGEHIPKEIGWAMTFYKKRTNLKAQWSKFCTRLGGKS